MTITFYLPRSLAVNGKTYTETELIAAYNYVVVLCEPGGGKTELMGSLARQLGTRTVTANVFVHIGADTKNCPLVIDAFDELAKVDQTGINRLLANARKANPTHVIISSRSSEWNSSDTHAFKEFFDCSPLIVRLHEFDESEQRAIFNHHLPGENFEAFQAEVARFDLEMLLPNPKFLELFADAYIESGRRFTDKHSIFAQAIERLAKEANINVASLNPTLSSTRKIGLSSEVFTKLLLSGAEGICTSEAAENRTYPLLASLFEGDAVHKGILATRLFKPGDSANQHRPVHKIVAEYCAANYLTKRIVDQADPLTLSKCLPVIAPNSTVRDELRGLLGWMATLGNGAVQKSVIELDPYAVLANGDPSQLEHSSKRLLVSRLREIENQEPCFQRGDFWRRFSIAGFFTQDVIEEIRPILTSENNGHLCDLILRLLVGSPAVDQLRDELRQIALSPTESDSTRWLAHRCLLSVRAETLRSDLDILISEASHSSLSDAAGIIEDLGMETFRRDYLSEFLRACSNLYPSHKERHRRTRGDRYFIKKFINRLELVTIEWLLDDLTQELRYTCGKHPYECSCRNGISKIVGSILDRYFELATHPFEPVQVWQWVKNLHFNERKDKNQSKSVQVLQQDDKLRQGIIAHVFRTLTERKEIFEIQGSMFDYNACSHAGLNFRGDDYKFIVDLAFETDNPSLWVSFMARHQCYRNKEDRGSNDLRRHMREQALDKPLFMREWAKTNRATAKQLKRDRHTWGGRSSRKIRRRRRKEDEVRTANIKYIQENRELIEGGRHWKCLILFSDLVLSDPNEIEQEFGDEEIVRNALRNCLDFIAPHVPELPKLAELYCSSQSLYSAKILYAACLEIMRVEGNLEGVNLRLLRALRTNISVSYGRAVPSQEQIALFKEVDRLVFHNKDSGENFLRLYVEPQMTHPKCDHPQVGLLNNEVFSHLRATLSIEWLKRFRELKLKLLSTLFEVAAQHGDRDDLKKIITERCVEYMSVWPSITEDEDIERKRTFWLVRAWYFLEDAPETYWNWLKADKDTVLVFYELSNRINRGAHSYWAKLTSSRVEAILNAFFDKDLLSHWGTGSPKGEKAYRFLTEVIWSISSDNPDDAIPVLERLLADSRFSELQNNLKRIYADQLRKRALRDFEPPTPQEVVNLLDCDAIVTVEGLRQLVIQELQDFQKAIVGGEFNPANRFYEKGERLNEVRSTEIIAERLNLRLEPKDISVTPEHQLKSTRRSDFTVTKMISGKRRLLVTEVKGQWHSELYTAASAQLYERYSIHPDAEQQGIFLAIWFGDDEKVAGHKKHDIRSAQELRVSIEEQLPQALRGLIDVFVLDVSKPE